MCRCFTWKPVELYLVLVLPLGSVAKLRGQLLAVSALYHEPQYHNNDNYFVLWVRPVWSGRLRGTRTTRGVICSDCSIAVSFGRYILIAVLCSSLHDWPASTEMLTITQTPNLQLHSESFPRTFQGDRGTGLAWLNYFADEARTRDKSYTRFML